MLKQYHRIAQALFQGYQSGAEENKRRKGENNVGYVTPAGKPRGTRRQNHNYGTGANNKKQLCLLRNYAVESKGQKGSNETHIITAT